jgi:hypothetical protein
VSPARRFPPPCFVVTDNAGQKLFLCDARNSPNAGHKVTWWRKGGERIGGASVMMAHFANKLHVDKQKVDRVESAVLLSLIGGGLALCVLGAAVYDIGRAFSAW